MGVGGSEDLSEYNNTDLKCDLLRAQAFAGEGGHVKNIICIYITLHWIFFCTEHYHAHD